MGKSTQSKILLSIGASNLGGAQRVFQNIIQVLDAHGFAVTVVIPKGPLVNAIQAEHPDISIHLLPSSLAGKILFFAKLIRREKFDLCCAHLGNASLWLILASLFSPAKICCTLHNVIFSERTSPIKKIIQKPLYRFIFRKAQSVVVVSEYLKTDTERKLGGMTGKITVIANGIPAFPHIPKPAPKTLTLGIVGRCTWEKGHLTLINALSLLYDLELKCRIIGDGKLLPEIKIATEKAGVKHMVEFVGWKDDVQKTISESVDVLVVPSLEEAFSLATLEAFSVSVPVIGSRCGGIPALIDHEFNGLVFEKGDVEGLAGAIRAMAEHPEKIPEMGAKGLEKFSQKFTLETHQQHWLEYVKGLG